MEEPSLLTINEVVDYVRARTDIPDPYLRPLIRDLYTVLEEVLADGELDVPGYFRFYTKEQKTVPKGPLVPRNPTSKVLLLKMSKRLYSLWNGSEHFHERRERDKIGDFPEGWEERFRGSWLYKTQKKSGAPLDF